MSLYIRLVGQTVKVCLKGQEGFVTDNRHPSTSPYVVYVKFKEDGDSRRGVVGG